MPLMQEDYPFAVVNVHGKCVSANARFVQMLGHESSQALVTGNFDILIDESRQCLQRIARENQHLRMKEFVVDLTFLCASGKVTEKPTHILTFAITADEQAPVMFMLRIMTSACLTQGQVFSGMKDDWYELFERLEWGVVLGAEEHGNMLYVNRAFAQMHGYSPHELVGRPIADVFAPQSLADLYHNIPLAHQKGHHYYESMHLHKSGHIFPVGINVSTYQEKDGAPQRRIVHVQDISNIKEAERILLESRDLLRKIAEQREKDLESERKKIARDIHDELGQLLTTLRLGILMMQRKLGNDKTGLLSETAEMMRVVDLAIDAVEHVATRLRPAVLDLGLVDALEWLVRDFAVSTKLVCNLKTNVESIELGDDVCTAIFRIVQESMTNVARHARATKIDITLNETPVAYEFCVEDNGVGFDVPSVRKARNSYGLLGMEERVHALGGALQIDSAPGEGTRVRVKISKNRSTKIVCEAEISHC